MDNVSVQTFDTTKEHQAAKDELASKKNVAEGMMDIALLTANANQLRFLLTYNKGSSSFYISTGLVITSLVLQLTVGIALIFRANMRHKGRNQRADNANNFIVVGVFLITLTNVFVASFTTLDVPRQPA